MTLLWGLMTLTWDDILKMTLTWDSVLKMTLPWEFPNNIYIAVTLQEFNQKNGKSWGKSVHFLDLSVNILSAFITLQVYRNNILLHCN